MPKDPKWKREGFDSRQQRKEAVREFRAAKRAVRRTADQGQARLREIYEQMGHRPKFSFSGSDATVFVRLGESTISELQGVVNDASGYAEQAQRDEEEQMAQLELEDTNIRFRMRRAEAASERVTIAEDTLRRAEAEAAAYRAAHDRDPDAIALADPGPGGTTYSDTFTLEDPARSALAATVETARDNLRAQQEAVRQANLDIIEARNKRDSVNSQLNETRHRAHDTEMALANLTNAMEWMQLESMQTISISIHEAKAPVRTLGYRGVSGYTRSAVTIAGTMIVTIIDKHPLSALIQADSTWRGASMDATTLLRGVPVGGSTDSTRKRNATRLSPFSLMIRYVSEVDRGVFTNPYARGYELADGPVVGVDHTGNGRADRDFSFGKYAGGWFPSEAAKRRADDYNKAQYVMDTTAYYRGAYLKLENVEIIDQSIVTSVNDITTEMVFNFTATNYLDFSAMTVDPAPLQRMGPMREGQAFGANSVNDINIEEGETVGSRGLLREDLDRNAMDWSEFRTRFGRTSGDD